MTLKYIMVFGLEQALLSQFIFVIVLFYVDYFLLSLRLMTISDSLYVLQ